MYYVYVLGDNEFINECIDKIKNKKLILSTTTDIDLFKSQVSRIEQNKTKFVIIDETKISKYNRSCIFFGTKKLTYQWLNNIEIAKSNNIISFQTNDFSEIEKKILDYINHNEILNNNSEPEKDSLIKQDTNYVEKVEENKNYTENSDFDLDKLIEEANIEETNFDNSLIEDAIENAIENQIDLEEIKVADKKEFNSKKIDIKGPKRISDNSQVNDDDIEKLIAEVNEEKQTTKDEEKQIKTNKIKEKTMAQKYFDTFEEDEIYDMYTKNEL